MPEFIIWAVSTIGAGIGGTTGAFLIMNAAVIATSALIVGGLAFASAQKKKAVNQYNAAQVDRLVTISSTTAPRELVMGRVRKAGTVFFKGSANANNTKFVMLVTLAAHEIDAVEAIYLNDLQVTLDGSGWVQTAPYYVSTLKSYSQTFTGNTVTLTHVPVDAAHITVTLSTSAGLPVPAWEESTGPLAFTLSGSTVTVTTGGTSTETKTVSYQSLDTSSKARIRAKLGAPGQTADADLIALFPSLWTSAHTASGIAYLICEFDYDETAFPSGLPNVSALIRGAKIYDPRTTLTWWTENPALMARHVLLHPQFGKRTSLSAAEDARIVAAANACDVSTIYTVNGVAQDARAVYAAGIVIPFGTTARDALDDLVQAMAGQWAYAAGAFYLRAGAYTASVKTLTDADLAVVQRGPDGSTSQQPITITTHRARDQMVNVVSATIWDKEQGYKQTALTPLKAAALIARDGAELVQDLTLPAVGYAPQALHICGILLRDARDPLTVTLPFKLSAYAIELFDVISLTLARYGWSAKTFLVLGREWTGDGSIQLTLKETTASIYTMDADFAPQGAATNTALPSPWSITAPTITAAAAQAVQLSDGSWVNNVLVTYTAQTAASALAGNVEVQWSWPGGSWQTVTTTGADTTALIPALADAGTLILRARTVTSIAVSGWSAQYAYAVPSPAAAPANFDSFAVSTHPGGTRVLTFAYAAPPPPDLAGAMIRFAPNASGSEVWGDMLPLNTGPLTYSPMETDALAAGVYRFAIKPITRAGVLCADADVRYVNATLPEVAATATPTTGLTGTRTAVIDLYQWADSAPTVRPSGASTLTWATGQGTAPVAALYAQVRLHLHLDGAHNSTSFPDVGPSPKTVTPSGNAKISTTQSHSGGASLYLDGTGDYLTAGVASDWTWMHTATAKWTLQAWVKPASFAAEMVLFSTSNGGSINSGIYCSIYTNRTINLQIYRGVTGSFVLLGNFSGTIPNDGAWHHVEISYDYTLAANNATLWIDGVASGTLSKTANAPSSAVATAPLKIGGYATTGDYNGYIDEFAILQDVILHTAAFTPPADALDFAATGWALTPGADVVGKTLYLVRNPVGNSEATATTVVDLAPAAPVEIKTPGLAGTRTAVLELYQWALSTPTAFPAGTSTYTWATGAFTAPATPAGWSMLPGASLANGTLYACRVLLDDTGSASTSSVTWPSSNTAHTVAASSTLGARGNRRLISTDAGYSAGYTYAGNAAGAASFAAKATDLIAAATVGSIPTTPIAGDEVTFANGTTYVYSIAYNGTAWAAPGLVIDGSLLVTGSVTAAALNALGLRVGTSGTIAATGYPGFSLDGSTPGDAGSDIAGARFGLNASGYAHVDTLLCWGNVFTKTVGAKAGVTSAVAYAENTSSGPGHMGKSTSGNGGHFFGNATKGPLLLDPLASLPSDKTSGQLCNVGGVLYFSNGTVWKTVNLT